MGTRYSIEQLTKIYAIGEHRYRNQIAPGFRDAANKQDRSKSGDLILWFQMIDFAKVNKVPIIFITNDQKPDWWRKKEDNKIEGPHLDLIWEMWGDFGAAMYWDTDGVEVSIIKLV